MNVMKPITSSTIPSGDEWLFEVKYDGFRCMLDWDANHIKLTSKNNIDLTKQFPEIVAFCLEQQDHLKQYFPLRLDGELVILNTAYQANFPEIQKRGRLKNKNMIRQTAERRPVTLMVFDIITLSGMTLETEILTARKRHLSKVMSLLRIKKDKRIQLVDSCHASDKLQKLIFDQKAEGLIAKRKKSTYQPGKSHHNWFKIKNWRHINGILHTYNVANDYFSISVFKDDILTSIGKCKHGLDNKTRQTLKHVFRTQGVLQNDVYTIPPAITASIHTLDLYDRELREPEFAHLTINTAAETCTVDKLKQDLAMFPSDVELSNLEKPFWPDLNITKQDLLIYMREIAPYMCPFMSERALTLMRCPDGVHGNYFFQKHLPNYAPEFISSFITTENKKGILCENLESLIWFANHGTIEYHLPFQTISQDTPIEIVFDLDPPSRQKFDDAIDAALLIKQILDDLQLVGFIKTSGNKGLQIHIPIPMHHLNYEETALFTQSIAWTVERMQPDKFTTERLKNKRHGRLYIDYVQHGKNKTVIAPYSPRKVADGTVATPLYWEEVKKDLRPESFTLDNVVERVRKYGCPFLKYFEIQEEQHMDKIKKLIRR